MRAQQIDLHVNEIYEALAECSTTDMRHPEYGPISMLSGVTNRGRAIHLKVAAHRLPMLLIEVDADPITPIGTSRVEGRQCLK